MSKYDLKETSFDEVLQLNEHDTARQFLQRHAQRLTLDERARTDEHANQPLVAEYFHTKVDTSAPIARRRPVDPVTQRHQLFDQPLNYDQEIRQTHALKDLHGHKKPVDIAKMAGHTGRAAELIHALNPTDAGVRLGGGHISKR